MFGNIFKKAVQKITDVKDDIKKAAIEKILEKELAKVPKEQQELMRTLITQNPELFEKIGKEIEEKTKAGTPQMYASMTVFKKYEKEIQKLMMNSNK